MPSHAAPLSAEFALIRAYFTGLGAARADVALDIGDDCALLRVPAHHELAVSIDTLVAAVHFFADGDPEALGHKALAVNLSDLAAVGAEPAWATLALTLPAVDEHWLTGFARGFAALATATGVRLVGGDITRGPLSITIQVHGFVPTGQALRRAGARPGDLIAVSGTLGDAGLALRQLFARRADPAAPLPDPMLRARLERPTPRLALGQALRGLASAAIDLSDGLAADLGHLLTASGCGARVELARLPLTPAVAAQNDWHLPLAAGDDYELCFTLPPRHAARLDELSACAGCRLSLIGTVEAGDALTFVAPDGQNWWPARAGYDHFER